MLINFNSKILTFGAFACIFYILYNFVFFESKSKTIESIDIAGRVKQKSNLNEDEDFIPTKIRKKNMQLDPARFSFMEKIVYFFFEDLIDKNLIKFQNK